MSGQAAKTMMGDDLAVPFLGIRQSAGGYLWRDRLTPERVHLARGMSQQHGIPDVLGRMLAARLDDIEAVASYLNPSIRDLMPDPFDLRDMETGATLIADAIMAREKIAVFGDYDVDGGTSSALLQRFLIAHDCPCQVYIPDRMTEGYGPNAAAMQQLAKAGAKLIVTVDCGSTAFDPLAAARTVGAEVVVIDHHQVGEELPACAALINPNRLDDLSGQGDLAAAGVVFLTLVAVMKLLRQRGFYSDGRTAPDLLQMLDLVALATICDVVPLTGLNRAYVQKGLQVMRHRQNAGLRALADIAGLQEAPNAYHLGFILGPRINAGGRIGNAGLGAQLLASDDEAEAIRIAQQLDRYNSERKAMEGEMLEAAVAVAERQLEADPDMPLVIVGADDWHRGLVGLLASRLAERFKMPALAIAWEGSEGTGSARSVQGVDVGAAIRAAVDAGLLVKGGGHAMAGGLTVLRDNLSKLTGFLNEQVLEARRQTVTATELLIDGALTPHAANESLMDHLDRAGPYGNGNPPPRFVLPAHQVQFAKVVGTGHIRCSLQAGDGSRIDAIAFRSEGTPVGDLLLGNNGQPLHIAGALKRDSWGGRVKVEMVVDDVADPRKNR